MGWSKEVCVWMWQICFWRRQTWVADLHGVCQRSSILEWQSPKLCLLSGWQGERRSAVFFFFIFFFVGKRPLLTLTTIVKQPLCDWVELTWQMCVTWCKVRGRWFFHHIGMELVLQSIKGKSQCSHCVKAWVISNVYLGHGVNTCYHWTPTVLELCIY